MSVRSFFILIFGVLCSFVSLFGQQSTYNSEIVFAPDEYWWGGVVGYGSRMPYIESVNEFNLALQNQNNQVNPFFLSNKGRYVWSDKPFIFEVKKGVNNTLCISSDFEQISSQQAGSTLREAYLAASEKYFRPSGTLPDSLFFTLPQYNTWIELMYNQNEKDILKYAQQIIDNGFPSGVLMIDDNWQKYYGNFDFKAEKFSNPRAMVEKLHGMGFKVMLWVCPFVSPDSPEYRELAAKEYLLKKKNSDLPAVIDWWNGQSACCDLTNPAAFEYFVSKLKEVQEKYKIDGFKFDAGDNAFYNPQLIDSYQKDAISTDHVLAWERVGLLFPFNEFRAGWMMGGQPLVERLGDKHYSWRAVESLVSEMTAAGLMGYPYTCPDMIGGGSFTDFLNLDDNSFDQKLIVRSAQVHALMPMMQFSVAPWRILNEENLKNVRKMALLHQQFGPYILEMAKSASKTGEPIVRHMEYAFPNEGFALCKDQFMLGDRFLVAPVLSAVDSRMVKLPKGKWRDDKGKVYSGGRSLKFDIPLERLLYFERLK